jgi:hypothetical protein
MKLARARLTNRLASGDAAFPALSYRRGVRKGGQAIARRTSRRMARFGDPSGPPAHRSWLTED